VEHGYARLDAILSAAASRTAFVPTPGPSKKVLLAPSWGACSSIEGAHGDALVRAVLGAGHHLVVRLHPMTVRHHPRLAGALASTFGADSARFRVVTDMNEQESLLTSDLMISDWSGAALDYAFGLERPVLFVDTPMKVNNPEFNRLELPPLEKSVREEIGAILPLTDLASAPSRIAALTADPNAFRDRIRQARERWVYHVGRSAEVAASHVARLLSAPVDAPREKVAT
jgi:CDP-glycerol glycerophosphotransferase (TagB/SpsB family)